MTTTNKETIALIEKQMEGKKPNAPLFQIPRSIGEGDKGKHAAIQQLQENIRLAAKKANVDHSGKKYSSHSGRKAFAQSRMNAYAKLSTKQLVKILDKMIETEERLKPLTDPDKELTLRRKKECTLKNINNKSKTKRNEFNHKLSRKYS